MYFKSLPAKYASGAQKDQQAYVQIANESIGHPADEKDSAGNVVKATALRIKQDDFVFPSLVLSLFLRRLRMLMERLLVLA